MIGDPARTPVNIRDDDAHPGIRRMNNLVIADIDRSVGRVIGTSVKNQISGKKILILDHRALLISLLLHIRRRPMHLII